MLIRYNWAEELSLNSPSTTDPNVTICQFSLLLPIVSYQHTTNEMFGSAYCITKMGINANVLNKSIFVPN